MALPRVAFPLVLQSPSTGSALVGANATITKHVVGGSLGGGAEATIFTEETGAGKTASNVITTDNTGRWTQGYSEGYKQYWIEEGRYDILISGTGLTAVYITRELVTGGVEAVTTERIANTAVTAGKIASEAVETTKIKALAVTEAKIAETTVTGPKLGSGTVRQETGTTQSFLSWGLINESGSIETGTGDYTITRVATGEYELKWSKAKSSALYSILGGSKSNVCTVTYNESSRSVNGVIIQIYSATTKGFVNEDFEFQILARS
jgi:hypothetical protein